MTRAGRLVSYLRTTLLMCCNRDVLALQLHKSWQAIPSKSVLAISHVEVSSSNSGDKPLQLLATTGHDKGAIRFWEMPFGEDSSLVSSPHKGSIFTLASRDDLLVSGSFDRSATVSRLQKLDSHDGISFEKVATLPEHTGWVRGVQIVSRKEGQFFLSIGCNLINVWEECGDDTTAQRLARLDAGPSPGDREDQDFRRHDILAIAVPDDSSFIVAGLVDGTLRAFQGKWEFWKDRRDPEGAFILDSTRSCGKLGNEVDDQPFAAVRAHEGRVTGIHALPNGNEFISVATDGCWRQWRLDTEESSFIKVAEGDIRSPDNTRESNDTKGHRICSSVIVPGMEDGLCLVVGTIGGGIYQIPLCQDNAPLCNQIWAEEKKDCPITALSWIPWNYSDQKIAIVAGTNDGVVRIFT